MNNNAELHLEGELNGLIETVIGCSYQVMNELGTGFLESVYEKALQVALDQVGIRAERQVPITVRFRKAVVGEFFADLLIGNKLVVELKTVDQLAPEHQAQVINYLNATGIPAGLLINFGNRRVEVKRLVNRKLHEARTAATHRPRR